MKKRITLEITFTDNTKISYDSELWDKVQFSEESTHERLLMVVNIFSEIIGWFPLRNIKSIMKIEEEVIE